MATDTKTTVNVPPPADPVPALAPPDMPQPAPGPVGNPLGGALMPAFVLMVFGASFIIHPMAAKGHGAAAVEDEALLAFCVFWLGAVSILCRRFLVARLPAVANTPAYIVRFVQDCVFGPVPPPLRQILEPLFW